ncbi:UNVERIFIED_ORG: putative membrane protein YqgA involved in biofilm formation [Arthrobacter sp. UYEF2]
MRSGDLPNVANAVLDGSIGVIHKSKLGNGSALHAASRTIYGLTVPTVNMVVIAGINTHLVRWCVVVGGRGSTRPFRR